MTASGLIDCAQTPRQDSRGEYAGSETWITARADVYMRLLSEVTNQSSAGKPADKQRQPTPDDTKPQRQKSELKPAETGADRGDKIDICLSSLMAPPSSSPQSPVTIGSSILGDCSGAFAPGALSPNFSYLENQAATLPPSCAETTTAPLIPGVVDFDQHLDSATSLGHSPAIQANELPITVAPIEKPSTPLAVGDSEFKRCTQRIQTAFPETEITMEHCHQVRSWMLRPSPLQRMTYDCLDDVLCEHESGYQLCDPSGGLYKLTLDWLLKAWPKVLLGFKHEHLKKQGVHAVDHCLQMMTSRADAEFQASIELEIKCINQEIECNGSDERYNPYCMFPRVRMLFAYIAFYQLGLTLRVNGIINDHQGLTALRDGMLESPLDALLAYRNFPTLFPHASFKPWFWNTLKTKLKKEYQALLKLKTEAEVWGLEEKTNYPALSDPK